MACDGTSNANGGRNKTLARKKKLITINRTASREIEKFIKDTSYEVNIYNDKKTTCINFKPKFGV